ncbi:MAG: cytidine deaminase [Proteobacteria bacterium]|nr:cytidine deaminase [Pseudomonadota bacterium]
MAYDSPNIKEILINKAKDASKNAYAPHSKFKVGAAVLTENGKIYTGCNVENASYGLTICAERNAIFSAVAHEGPHMRLKMIVVSTNPQVSLASSCGACRQVISEFASKDTRIIFPKEGDYIDVSLEEILPLQFVFVAPFTEKAVHKNNSPS